MINRQQDSYRHRGLRRQLVDSIQRKGIRNQAILAAIGALPRHLFLDKAFEEWAYQDKPFPIGNKQTISQPFTVAYQTSLLKIGKRDKVLEIGTGSGYQAAILSLLGARVYTVERQKVLYERTRQLLQKLDFKGIRTFYRDGMKGLPEFAPFDRILVTAGAKEIPEALKVQLSIGGHLVIPVGEGKYQKMIRLTRLSETEFSKKTYDTFSFVPLLGGTNERLDGQD
ncbi:MAG: protein-L-isoaspartate(D-aspartate) O-methyltransferase [Bacteroidota bacterium]